MSGSIFIGMPYITRKGDKTRLCSDVSRPGSKITLYFEVPCEYEKYLCTERSNSFVLAVFEYAMYMGYNIKSDCPLDECLHYQLCNYGAVILSKQMKFLHNIKLDIPFTNETIKNENAVGTGFSAGVDSFYSSLKHINPKEKSYKLTHLILANCGAFTYSETEKTEKLFFKQINELTPAAEELGLPLVSINTNLSDFYLDAKVPKNLFDYIYGGSALKIAGCVYSLQKLFSKYYIASSAQLDKFKFKEDSSCVILLYHTKLFSIPTLMFYGSGTEATRLEKVEYICKNKTVQNYLSLDLGKNCSRCGKCIRTMFELYSLNMLDYFGKVLDIDDFKKHLSNRLAKHFCSKIDNYDGFVQESIAMCKKNGVKIPKSAYIKCYLIYKPYNFFRKYLRNSIFVRKLYYALNLDVKIYGKESKAWRSSYLPEKK